MKKSRFVVLCNKCKSELGVFEDIPRDLNYIQIDPCKKCAAKQSVQADECETCGAIGKFADDECIECGTRR